jgi:glycosyltransferase involved in cell wall biosynthesis
MSCFRGNFEKIPVSAPLQLNLAQLLRVVSQPAELIYALRRIKEFSPDVIHFVFSYPWFSLLMPVLSRSYRILSTLHDITPHPGERSMRNWLGIYSSVRYSDKVFIHGPTSCGEAEKLYPAHREKYVSIPHGNFNFLVEGVATNSLRGKSQPTFLFFGRILPYKGLPIALSAFAKVYAECPQSRLVIAGAGDIPQKMVRELEFLGAIEVRNYRLSIEELAELLNSATAVLAPYIHASGSGVVATSYAFSCPVIASNIGGLRDMVIPGETGILVEPNDVSSLVEAMLFAIHNSQIMKRLGNRAREYAADSWGWGEIAKSHIEVYLETCGGVSLHKI